MPAGREQLGDNAVMGLQKLLVVASLGICLASGAASAQQAKVWRIGFIDSAARSESLDALRQGMRDLGYVEGRNIQYEVRHAGGKFDVLPELAADLVKRKVDVIVTGGTPATRAARHATNDIPIVMVFTGDPVETGLVASFARPGANVTGISNVNVEINPKRVDLLLKALPKVARVGALLNSANPTYSTNRASLEGAARKAKITLHVVTAEAEAGFEGAFAKLGRLNVQALIVQTDSLYISHAAKIAKLATNARLPIMGPRELVTEGGLMSYQPNRVATYRRAATYVDRIFKGGRPAEMPVELPTKFDLTLNLKAAKALGISLPRDLVSLADEVIQ
jgi:putative ABC transport system substrate-binding protein